MQVEAARTAEQRIAALAPRFARKLTSALRFQLDSSLPFEHNLSRIDSIASGAVSTALVIQLLRLLEEGYQLGVANGLTLLEREVGAAADPTDLITLGLTDVHLPHLERWTKQVVMGITNISALWRNRLRDELIEGYYAGESIPKLGKRVRKVMNSTRAQSLRLARTATNDVYNLGHLDSYAASGLEYVQVSAHIDDRTSDICLAMNGLIYRIEEAERPPYHFNCRTRLIPWFGGAPPAHAEGKVAPELKKKRDKFRGTYWHTPKAGLSALPKKTMQQRAERISRRLSAGGE